VEETKKAVIRPIDRAPNECCNIRRAQKAMMGDVADNRHIALCQAKCRRLRCASESRPSRHAGDIPNVTANKIRQRSDAKRFELSA
jgi:hypothetical protein